MPVDRYVLPPSQVDGGVVYTPSAYERYRTRHRFPINTVIGAGVGAVIGNQRGRRSRGAWIGGSIGLMFDLMRGWR